jgi:hypothetical protein
MISRIVPMSATSFRVVNDGVQNAPAAPMVQRRTLLRGAASRLQDGAMGEIVNLRQARKRQERARREAEAAANRVRFGRTGAEKRADAMEAERRDRAQDGARLETDPKDR